MKKVILIGLLLVLTFGILTTGAELDISVQKEPRTLNPFRARSTWSWKALSPMLEGLLSRDMNHKIIPWLAEQMPEFQPEEGRVVVRLKENVKWHDGTEFTAKDVAFTYKLIRYFDFPLLSYRLDPIEEVKVKDKYTVFFKLDMEYLEGTNSPVLYEDTLMQFIVQKDQWLPIFKKAKGKSNPMQFFWQKQPKPLIGTGAFAFQKWQTGSYVYLKSFPDYHMRGKEINGKKLGPFIDGIMLKIYKSTNTAILALKKGKVDVVGWPLQKGYLKNIKKSEELKVSRNESNGFFYLAPNLRKDPWKDYAFRKAVNQAIDRDFIVRRILKGLGSAQYSVVPPGNKFWHNPNIKRKGTMKEAKETLRKAGYTWEKNRLVKPDGEKVKKITITSPPANYDPMRFASACMIQRWIRKLGVPAIVEPLSFAQIITKAFDKREFDCFILGFSLGISPDFMRVFYSSEFDVPGGYNSMGFRNEKFDELAKKAMLETNKEKRQDLVYRLQKILADDLPVFPLYNRQAVYGRNKEFKNWHETLGGPVNGWSYLLIKKR